jgi:hypothetical protein
MVIVNALIRTVKLKKGIRAFVEDRAVMTAPLTQMSLRRLIRSRSIDERSKDSFSALKRFLMP